MGDQFGSAHWFSCFPHEHANQPENLAVFKKKTWGKSQDFSLRVLMHHHQLNTYVSPPNSHRTITSAHVRVHPNTGAPLLLHKYTIASTCRAEYTCRSLRSTSTWGLLCLWPLLVVCLHMRTQPCGLRNSDCMRP